MKLILCKDETVEKRTLIKELQKSIRLFDKYKENAVFKDSRIITESNHSVFPSWQNIYFYDGYIEINVNSIYCKFKVGESKRYLNQIKHYYSFKNVPKLVVIFSENEIKEIKNIEILFYHIDFLTIANNYFSSEKLQISKFAKYTKSYCKKYIPFVFTTSSLEFLCEICDEDFPIIPVPELVINSNQSKVIHDSFLFKCGNKLIWESIETSKASYIFKFDNFSEDAQYIFDYIINRNMTNKRQTLIKSYDLRNKLKLRTRIYHNEFSEWKKGISFITTS